MFAAPRPSSIRCLLLLLCASIALPALHAQSTEADIKARLMGKPIYLRGFWRDDKLHFDPAGRLLGNSDPVSFTLCGFDLEGVHLKQGMLILEGRRVGLELASNKQKRVALQVGDLNKLEEEEMHIEIDSPPSGDYAPALDTIFADGLAELAPSLPFYWKDYAQKNFLPASPTTNQSQPSDPSGTKPKRVGGGVSPPTVVHSKEPDFNDPARKLKYGGKTTLRLHVETDGTVSHLSVLRALGLELDERALASVDQYTFTPAKENGTPVVVELAIEVNFQIY